MIIRTDITHPTTLALILPRLFIGSRAQRQRCFPTDKRNLLIAIALAEFSYETGDVNPELADYARQLAADRLVAWDVTPKEAVDELPIAEL